VNTKQRILLVDDDPRLIRLVREVLCATGFGVLTTSTGEQAAEMIAIEQPDLVVLDIMLQNIDGIQIAKRVREFSDVPIIMLTAKVSEADKLRGFDAGADDYITKPFSSKELLARVRALLKRVKSPRLPEEAVIQSEGLAIDLARHCVTIEGNEVYLTATEYNLLRELATHSNKVMLHGQLLTAVWGPQYRDEVEYLRSYVHALRKKIEIDPSHPKRIVSIPGVGYKLAIPDSK
jgi:two-component system KDP operon response regulator KdpE